MEAIKAIEKLNWMKQEQINLDLWLSDLEINNKPVNGVHWRRLKKTIEVFEEDLIGEIRSLEYKIHQKLGDIEIDV
ncbi:hypothetical protein ABE28_008820 [Peribacillus muralis]|uniref:Uncharacterized protein n=1 Tax=Peribacillus muralis TaxID=264697 RepID=A0A1B3XMM9_9BACI|nr:hypothetical protein [Peribacillus muralis]AOH54453.1 hypothetical protein ABE28_008820 [Peribacillus muralis]